ncbi:transcriptional regulator with XRE-family HTH domain [Chryseobacterium sp. H1D6B]|uniref:helix-turn-helix domain-containing protein n=1 Tax=Chryseobacterium sp. H1D6B TaxID=2940588 RepID=UPI0015CE8357|nr:helix-turn-helix domain-containing protein [Chryseobacterium sp. H1D6B]MDH6252824.1 transcriptional regulator with XRE-family HTH domain [Chryseobacterium sp. H1D6B]
MPTLKAIREQKNLTQEELAEKSKISVRTIQRIESGTEPKGHTLRALAQALDIQQNLLQDTAVTDEVKIERKEEEQVQENINYSFIKIINLSSLLFVIVPPINILVPLLLLFKMKQRNSLARQIISVQILWTITAPIVFMLGIFLKPGAGLTLAFMIIIILSNIFIIIRNAAEIDRHKKLYYRLNFNMI